MHARGVEPERLFLRQVMLNFCLREESFSTRENQQKCRNRIFVAATHVHHYKNWVTFSGKAQNPR